MHPPPEATANDINAAAVADFLSLPGSQLAIRLSGIKPAPSTTWHKVRTVLLTVVGSGVAIGGVIAAIKPIQELNHWAYDSLSKRAQFKKSVAMATDLLEVSATDAAEQELKEAVDNGATGESVDRVRAGINCQRLMKNPKLVELKVFERRYHELISKDEHFSYLLGMCYLDIDMRRSQESFERAITLAPDKADNVVRVSGGLMRLKGRSFEQSGDIKQLETAQKLFTRALRRLNELPADRKASLSSALEKCPRLRTHGNGQCTGNSSKHGTTSATCPAKRLTRTHR